MELRKKFLSVAALAFAAALSAGVAVSAGADGEQALTGFNITDASVRLGAGTQEDPSGLRFKTVTPAGQSAYVEAYTNITFTSSVVTDKNPNGAAVNYSAKVPTSSWREDGWNTVLLEIPSSDYGTQITAQSYVKVSDTEVYVTDAKTTSIAKTASLVMAKNNETNAALEAYVAGAVESITLNAASGSLSAGETVQLTATTAPAGFGVLWTSSDSSIATVDSTGKVTATGIGQATITASMGGKTATYTVNCTMPYSVDFESGANVFVSSANDTQNGGVQEVANGNHGVQLSLASGKYDLHVGLNKAWLANAFANSETTSVSFKVYTDMDGYGTYNKYNGNSITGSNGTLYYKKDGALVGAWWPTLTVSAKTNGAIKITINRAYYTNWLTNATNAGVTDSDMYVLLRLGKKEVDADTGLEKEGFGWAYDIGTVYIDDLKADIPVKYDPINNDPLAQDTTFESGTNALISCFAPITDAGVEEVAAGNKAVKLTMPANGYDIYVGFNATWLEDVFETKSAELVTFKVYTTMDGWGTYNKYNGNAIGNGEVGYVNNGNMTRLPSAQASVGASEKTDGYLTLTLDKNDYTAWANAKGTVDSNLYIMMRLGDKEEGKTGFGYGYPVGDIYIDDVTVHSAITQDLTFESGWNALISAGNGTTGGSVAQISEGNKGVALTASNFDINVGINAAWLAQVFADGAKSISFKVYTSNQDGDATYNGYGGGSNPTNSGTLSYLSGSAYTNCVWNATTATAKTDGYITYTISKAKYDEWVSKVEGAGATDSAMYVLVRLGVNENRTDVSGFGYGVVKPGTVYVDDVTVNK